MNKTSLISKSNDLIEARYKLSLNEQRLIILLISIIQPDDDDFHDYDLHVSEFAIMFGIECIKDIHARVEEAAKNLVGKRLDLSIGKEKEYVAWFSHAKYIEGKGVINISFHKSLKPYLLQLKSRFTQYKINSIVKFKSSYSIRFYELLKSYEYLGNGEGFYREFSLAELKSFLGVDEGEYKNFGHLKCRIIEPSVKEINSYSDIFISSVDYIKEGRAVKRLKFVVEPKKNNVFENQPSNPEVTLSEDALALKDFGIAEPTAQKWIKEYGTENILKACRFVRAKQAVGEVKDVPAYLAKALKDGYYVAWIEGESKKEAKRSAEMARKAQKEEEERKAKEAVRLRIDAALEAFHARPEIEQMGLRAMFGNTANPITAKAWKKSMAAEPQPENIPRFRFEFATFLESYQPA
jgi:plasmid replication initiation protein